MSRSYKDSGVDKEEGYRAVEKMKEAVAATHGPQVLGGLGAFASLYALKGWKEPVLVAGTDGVGTKLRLALDANRLDVIGRDCYAMVANDIACHGAIPLFFLDYLACGKLDADVAAGIVAGMAQACKDTGCALVGGETAEMPGFYAPGDYDVAGFSVGVVEQSCIVDGSNVEVGDALIGLASNGVHSNGFSLIRSLFPDLGSSEGGRRLRDQFLVPTRLYGNTVSGLLNEGREIRGMAHITGGGLPENLPRALGGLGATVDPMSWTEPLVFHEIRKAGIDEEEMRGTFNLGIGYVFVVPKDQAEDIRLRCEEFGEKAWIIGSVSQEPGVCFA